MNFLQTIKTSILCVLCPFLLQSCGDSIIGETSTYVVKVNSKEWLTDTTDFYSFSLRDNESTLNNYSFNSEWSAFNISISGDGFNRKEVKTQVTHQQYNSNNGIAYRIELEAAEPPYGDMLSIKMDDLSVNYNIEEEELKHISSKYGRAPDTYYVGNEGIKIPMKSQLIYHSTYDLNDITINGVIEFNFLDFQDEWEDSTIISILYAKKFGLLSYTLNNGTIYLRQP